MKKQLLSLCIVIGTMTFAQSTDEPRFGIKAGGNLSSITDGDSKSKLGFYGGVFINIPISEAFSIQPEAIYSLQGAKLKDDYDFVGYTITNMKQTLGYINVPVMVQYNATPEFYLEAGPEFGLLINAQAKGDINGNSYKTSNKDALKTFNFGLGLGLGYKFTPNIGINARYIAGLSNIVKNSGEEISKNTNFQLGLNYYF
ncbi:PorT family protein [Chryseobacterium antibioticum]|uniref:PorT family protein n=1 Tax=Chryseobacterium pyrolae TaxID=2987481 RepID=A0ABT2IN05_9FLAO|nr:porin family protein [Chryseobacterium pyrolae]MCT2409964.1 PorT family protein [Chryseobacterium pyrolae]